MEKKQPYSTTIKKAAPTRAQIKNRIIKGFFVSLFTALVPSGGSGVGNAEEMKTATTAMKKKPGYSVKGGSRAVAAAVLTPASSCYESEGNLDD